MLRMLLASSVMVASIKEHKMRKETGNAKGYLVALWHIFMLH